MINPPTAPSAIQIREPWPRVTRQATHGRTLDLNAFCGGLGWGQREPMQFIGFDDEDEDEPTLRELFAAFLRRLAKRIKRGQR